MTWKAQIAKAKSTRILTQNIRHIKNQSTKWKCSYGMGEDICKLCI